MNNLQIISGVKCYEENGTAYLRLEDVARGLGFTTTQNIQGTEYTNIRWKRVDEYLEELGFATCGKRPDYIPENIFYRLAMKAKNETAEKFQALVADEIIPSIRRTGGYIAGQKELSPDELMAKALMVAQKTLADREAQISSLTVQNQIMTPKADYFDEIVDRNLLTNFRETAKQLGIGEKSFIAFLLEKRYVYRDKRGKLMPYAEKNTGLFEMKECFNEKTQWAGTQTLITPKGRETFRLLCKGIVQ
ncbi:phage antirepressor KilAC domain-containing protein [Gemmiger sp. An194]|uniref:phage antirepressor KilAC domain-containing protein n=1 Tax=Gemmiger sp. An194 TaxID=1965582 RepID=UPI000B368364|nr:phage antirepressor KilAC domain-containing protein [Gemmiger sp. An194]OUP24420.1 phage repressor protein/antirepressor Ant [Gemmiger sp. An194]